MRYKIWDGKEDLITPIGEVLTAEDVKKRYPMANRKDLKFIVCDSAISMGVFMEMTSTKETYAKMGATITHDMTDEQVLEAITAFEERPIVQTPSAEERIAAAMEYANLLKMMEVQK